MTWKHFAMVHENLMQAQRLYIESLPGWVQWWMTWMMFAFASSLLFVIWKEEARVALIAVVLSLFATYWVGYYFGWNRLWGITHLIFWSPALYFLIKWWPSMEFRPTLGGRTLELTPLFKTWGVLIIGTMGISLAFDLVDVVRYFSGDP